MIRIFANIYIAIRKSIRDVVINNEILDFYVGNFLVKIDIAIRKTGLLESKLNKKFIIHKDLYFYYTDEDKSFISFLITNNDYEKETRESIESILEPGNTFIDLGANIGFFSLIASRVVGSEGKIYSFEPTPSTFRTLNKNVNKNNFLDRVVTEKIAISDKTEKVYLKLTEGSEMNSIIADRDESTIEVDAMSLDDYFISKSVEKIDLIKMDIEGQELKALQGAKKIINSNKYIKIIFEFHKEALSKNYMSGMEIFELLQSYGFNKFTVLVRVPYHIVPSDDFEKIRNISSKKNLNILAEKISK